MGHRSRILMLLLVLGALLASTSSASAQYYREGRDATVPKMELTFGIGGTPTPGRWMPINATFDGGVVPFGGVLRVTYRQDPTQFAVAERPIAVTPNKQVSASLMVKPPIYCDRMLVELVRDGGRVEIRRGYTLNFQRRGERQLPDEFTDSSPLVLLVGPDRGVIRAARGLTRLAADSSINVVRVDPDALYSSLMAYDGCLIIAADRRAFEQADDAHVRAIRTWTNAGGRLLLFVDEPGSAWKDWLPPAPLGELVGAAPVAEVEIPDRLRHSDEDFARPTITARRLSLTALGRQNGWTVADEVDGGALMAEGPVGLGWVTVVGYNPRELSDPHDADWTERVVKMIGRGLVADFADVSDDYYWYQNFDAHSDSVGSAKATQARTAILERLGDIPGAGRGIFVIIVLSMLLLALAVGPIDAVVLKRKRLRHRSWLTALCWIGIATLGAVYLPGLIRAEKTMVHRMSVIDTLSPTPDGTGALAFESSLTAIFSASRGTGPIGMDGPSWWSGVALINQNAARPSTLEVMQRESRVPLASEPADAWGGFGTDGNSSARIERTALRLWTLRTLEDRRRVEPSVHGSVVRDGETITVTLTGLPRGVELVDATAAIADHDPRRLVPDASDPTRFTLGNSRSRLWLAPEDPAHAWAPATFKSGHAFMLRGPDRRTMSIDHRREAADWAVLQFRYTINQPPELGVERAGGSHEFVHRLVVPITDADGADATLAAPSPSTPSGPDA